MSTLLDAIRAEREALLAPIAHRLAVLDEIERLAERLNGAPERAVVPKSPLPPKAPAAAPRPLSGQAKPKPPAAVPKAVLPARAPATRSGIDGLSEREQALLSAVRSKGSSWLALRDLTAVVPAMSITSLKRAIKTLIGRGLIEAQGATSQRRYRAANPDSPPGGSTPPVAPASPEVDDDVVDEPSEPDAPPAAAGTLDAKAARILRARILDHLSRRRLTEQSLADHLNAEREHVADIVGKLLTDDAIILDPDGRYRCVA